MKKQSHNIATLGYLLQKWRHKERSWIQEFWTEGFGKLRTFKRSLSRAEQFLQRPFLPLWLQISGKGSLKQLQKMEPAQGEPFSLAPKVLLCGLYLNELIVRLLPLEEKNEKLFFRYESSLQALQRSESAVSHLTQELPLREFELAILNAIGYGLSAENINLESFYQYTPNVGFVKSSQADMRETLRGDKLQQAIHEIKGLDLQSIQTLKGMIHKQLAEHLGNYPLQTRKLFQAFNRVLKL